MSKLRIILFTTIFYGILCKVWSQEYKVSIYYSPEEVLKLRKIAESCGKEYGVDPKELRKTIEWTMPDDKPHKQFLFCTYFNAGYVDENSQLNMSRMLELKPLKGTMEDLKQISDECGKIKLENPIETIYKMGACFHKYVYVTLEKPNVK